MAGAEAAVVALNNGAADNSATIPVGAYFAEGTRLRDALGGASYTVSAGGITLTLGARSGVLLLATPT